MNAKPALFIPEMEGLRGLMALWVFVYHALYFCELRIPILYEGWLGVPVFMILSGFVITRLCVFHPAPYPSYLFRRLARLYPVYLIALLFGIAISQLTVTTYLALPWKVDNYARLIAQHDVEQANFIPLLISHLSLLHGVFPEEIMKGSAQTFVPAAWSLSLEWQFYLVAPTLIWLLQSRRYMGVTLVAAIFLTVITERIAGHFTYYIPSFLPLVLLNFIIGIVSALLFDHLKNIRSELLIYGGGAVFCAIVMLGAYIDWGHPALPFLIWLVALFASLQSDIAPLQMTSRFLTCRAVSFLGRISYGFYLLHGPVIICMGAELFALGIHNKMVMIMGLLLLVTPATLALSSLSYYAIELPVMRWAKNKERKNI